MDTKSERGQEASTNANTDQPGPPNARPAKRPGGPSGGRGPRNVNTLFWLLFLGLLLFWMWSAFSGGLSASQIDYSAFREQLKAGNVERIVVEGEQIDGSLKEAAQRIAEGDTVTYERFRTYLPAFGDEELLALLEAQNVAVETHPADDGMWWTVALAVLPLVLILGIAYLFLRRMRSQGQGLFSIRKSRARLYDKEENEKTTFDDVAGADGAKTELQEIIAFLKNPKRFERFGAEVPKGVLLVGPPGTGKTLLARAIAGEAGVPFFSLSGSDFMEMFVGVGASRVRDLFKQAKEKAPCIIFIDELDSIGRQRGAGLGGGHDEREQTLNQLLSELDGFEPNENVIVVAATNRPDILDPALLRPGRFDRRITVDAPALPDRVEILKIHARDKPLAGEVDLERVARGTPGFSGADLANLLNEAALLAARKDQDAIHTEDVEEARDKIIMGLERTGLSLEAEEVRLVAYHEAGHALVAAVLEHTDPIHKVTIVPRGRAMGVTQQLPEREKYIYRREYLLDRMAVMMGGRAAEALVFDTATSGAENDFSQATKLARQMVLRLGMSEQIGPMSLNGQEGQVFLGERLAQQRTYSEQTAREADEEIKKLLAQAYRRAHDALRTHRDSLDRLADYLIEHEEATGERVLELLSGAEKGSEGRGKSD